MAINTLTGGDMLKITGLFMAGSLVASIGKDLGAFEAFGIEPSAEFKLSKVAEDCKAGKATQGTITVSGKTYNVSCPENAL